MKTNRNIVHLDADAFFASVEQASDPRLRGRPIAVGGEKRGIIASASYEARKMGVYTPMPTARARKLCPKLIVLPGDFEKYERFSQWMFSYAYDFTPDVEISSIDEGYFDLSRSRKPPVEIATTIRQAILQSLKITVSEGVASSKLVSQIASKLNKPNAFMDIPRGREKTFLQPLPNHWLPGIGPKMAQKFNAAGLARIGQIAATPVDLLQLLAGSMALELQRFANAIDERPIIPVRDPAKSYSQQETFPQDTTDEELLAAWLRRMADNLMAKVRAEGKSIRTVTVKVRYNDMAEDQASESLDEPTDLETDLYSNVTRLLGRAWKRRVSLRMISLKFSNVYEGVFRAELPLEASARQAEARRRLATTIDVLRDTCGTSVILRGHDFILASSDRGKPPPPHAQPNSSNAPTGAHAAGSDRPRSQSLSPQSRQSPTDGAPALLPVGECGRRPDEGRGARKAKNAPSDQARQTTTCIPLHVHSYYSFLDSTLTIEGVVEQAVRHKLPAIALTDTKNLHGAIEFFCTARQAGIKPIIGSEARIDGKPVRLLVQDKTGYRNLCRLLSLPALYSTGESGIPSPALRAPSPRGRGMGESEPSKPKTPNSNRGLLTPDETEGLLAIGPDPSLAPLFPGRFYWGISSVKRQQRLSNPNRLPLVASTAIHYALPEDRWKFDMVQSIRTCTLLRQAHPEKRMDGHFHFPSIEETQAAFKDAPELLNATSEIAGRCHFEFTLGKLQFPAFPPPDGSSPHDFLRRLVMEGLRRRYPDRHDRMRPQVEEELSIIGAVGYEEYFLVVWDLLQTCLQRGIHWITRGSAADSLVCYCLGISDVCPIRFDLYFRRFLNQERMLMSKLPDIDVDFPHDRKDEVIDLIFEKYGSEHAAVVGGFSTYQARGAVGDVCKVLGLSEHQTRRFTEHFPFGGMEDLATRLAESQECRDLPLGEEPYRTAVQMACFLDGFPRYPKMHPCGVVLSGQPMLELTPIFRSNKGYPTTHYDMDSVEALGLVKIDILAQGGLAVMRDACEALAQRGIATDLQALEPWQDPQVWEMIACGHARAVHHIESPAMIGLCRQCNVRDIDGLIAIVSVIRPGAANEHKKLKFTRRYQGLEAPEYPDPSLEPCLKSTFGLVVYEEHILQMCEVFAGMSAGRADVLRRALSKHKQKTIDEIQAEFESCARKRGRPETAIAEVWGLIRGFAGYAFCKAHSTAYGVEAYQSAWLKRYYPAEFMAGVLTNGKGFYHPLVYVLECHRLGIRLLPPSVNQPGPKFQVEPIDPNEPRDSRMPGGYTAAIRVPAIGIKGLTDQTIERMLRERRKGGFESLQNFYRRVAPAMDEMEALIRAGALDIFGQTRTRQYWDFQSVARAFGQAGDPDQGWLLPPPNASQPPPVPLDEPTRRQRLDWESDLLGYTVSGHPLELHDDVAWETYCPISRIGEHVGEQIVTCGLVIEQRLHHQATGELMKFLTIADWTGMVETELFAPTYRSYGLATVRYPVLEITATVEPYENRRGFSLRVHHAGKPRIGLK